MAREPNNQPITADCRHVEREIAAYLAQGLSEPDRESVRRHLQACDACTRLVQEARSVDAELRQEARRMRQSLATLPPSTSAEIQEKVYRRMRRALLFQRTFHFAQQLGTVAAFGLFLVALLFIFNPWRLQLSSLSAPEPSVVAQLTPMQLDQPSASSPPAQPTAVPTVAPTAVPARASSELPVHNPPAMPAQAPGPAAQAIIGAAISADDAELTELLSRSRPLPEAAFRVWRRLERCQSQLVADDFTYRVIMHEGRFASIYVFNPEDDYLGDIKMWLGRDGSWFVSTMNYSSFAALKTQCLD